MSSLSDAAKEAKRQYYRDYRAKNKEKIQETNNRFWEKKAKEAQQNERQ